MSKIVRAVNSIVLNSKKITNIIKKEENYFFLFDNKYKWSIRRYEDDYFLTFYPGTETLDNLFIAMENFINIDSISYDTIELKTREARESFAELYMIIKEKAYKLDEILDNIIDYENKTNKS